METLSTDRQPVSPGCLRGAEWSSRNGPSSPMLLVPGTERGIRGHLVWPRHQLSRVRVRVRAEALRVPSSTLPSC